MTVLSASDRSKLSKLLAMIGSSHDGEALTAARKAHELVATRGATWPQIFGLDDKREAAPEPDHLVLARELLGKGKGIITDWERKFLIGVMAFKSLQPKQQATLDALKAKVEAARMA